MKRIGLFLFIALFTGCNEPNPGQRRPAPPPPSLVTGQVVMRERAALSRGMVVRVSLIDASRSEAIGSVVAEQIMRLDDPEQPLLFTLRFSPGAIDPGHRYLVQARVLEGEQLRYVSRGEHAVLTGGAPPHAVVPVEPASAAN